MSSDGYFDDELDSGILNELDIIEAAHFNPKPPKPASPAVITPKRRSPLKRQDSEFFDLTFDIDEADLQRIDAAVESYFQGEPPAIAGPSRISRTSSKNKQQTDLFGKVVSTQASSGKTAHTTRSPMKRTKSNSRNPFGHPARQTKQWDHTAFAKTGWRKPKSSKGKGKAKAAYGDESDGEQEEAVEFEQFPAPLVSAASGNLDIPFPSRSPPPPMKLKPDLLETKHWIYPLNQPKRDYQFNIVKHCLFENTLVALPTGLGKTFIAGVVMLNFYRWFPEGKIVFIAPTKPLVAQQIDACHSTCGIPGHDAIEMTGNNARAYRSHMWEEKRVFYMTPQTLINDLTSENCDPQNIILVVIDEAHKGTGDYAYAQVIRYLMAKNAHFRVLALTATPGSTPDAVQSIIDSLHISRIEIRDEQSLDLRGYMHKKDIKQHIIRMDENVNKIMDLLAKMMEKIARSLSSKGVMEPVNVVKMHPYRMTALRQQLAATNNPNKWAFGPISKLETLSRAMGYLMEASTSMCYTCLQELAKDKEDNSGKGNGKGQKPPNKLRSDPEFQAILREIESQRIRGFSMHPKMEMLKTLLVQHFGATMADGEQEGGTTRAMVFVTFRDCVDEIVEVLNEEMPLLKATRFIGQGTDKQGRKGFAQKEQIEVLKKFKAGEFNVLVSTSIGEEGLDIGEVDMIICYDAQKTPIRMLQRVGRTGRKRDGYVHVLLSEIREEDNWEKAKDAYGELQKSIVRGDQLELYSDVERLLPSHVKPELLEKKMDIEEYVREESSRKAASLATGEDAAAKGKKRRRNEDPRRNMPDGASTGFVSVADLVKKGAKKRKTSKKEFDPLAGEDDSTDMELESGLLTLRRAASASASTASKQKPKARLRKSSTMGPSNKTKASTGNKKKRVAKIPEPSDFSEKCADDSDDMDIQRGTLLAPCANSESSSSRKSLSPIQVPGSRPTSPEIPLAQTKVIAKARRKTAIRPRILSDQEDASPPSYSSPKLSESRKQDTEAQRTKRNGEQHSPLPEDNDIVSIPSLSAGSPYHWSSSPVPNLPVPDEVIELTSSPSASHSMSPVHNQDSPPQQPSLMNEDEGHSNKDCSSHDSFTAKIAQSPYRPGNDLMSGDEGRSMAWLLDDDEDIDMQILNSSPLVQKLELPTAPPRIYNDSIEIVDEPILPSPQDFFEEPGPTDGAVGKSISWTSPIARPDQDFPEASFAVRPIKRSKKQATVVQPPDFSPVDMPPPSQRRLQRRTIDSPLSRPSARRESKKPRGIIQSKANPWVAMEAAHSGDEESEGSSHPEDDVESESDRQFLHDMSQTQASPSYNQSLVYRQSLLTQAPAAMAGPAFANRPTRRGALLAPERENRRQRLMVSSSPLREEEPDEYVFGSFVVDDDADISFSGPSSDL
ncbi:hypothetical protein SERLA73DRAFT_76832 [Serpula lacrymans var. lacrymans S7.3]|uniref:ATP-dependent DNA helicase n=2 Tax=Serpula lacrymans var. lacrymans TaxID=341189 RepID=F8Q878_SERL3|nr:uncharacterized protein SERLADRAFT_441648 [Serpula lacrymans var. lacrymans S7.9]EGN95766.1 hypothetical protein SERLA73DRAFT_76832 [Serpula lacrymans var. lacrymans S7.3]EGO21290.1 hypothetical protein SERLADRAFT_441648 [Serpula lacrymans var. lacrymans S7.9]